MIKNLQLDTNNDVIAPVGPVASVAPIAQENVSQAPKVGILGRMSGVIRGLPALAGLLTVLAGAGEAGAMEPTFKDPPAAEHHKHDPAKLNPVKVASLSIRDPHKPEIEHKDSQIEQSHGKGSEKIKQYSLVLTTSLDPMRQEAGIGTSFGLVRPLGNHENGLEIEYVLPGGLGFNKGFDKNKSSAEKPTILTVGLGGFEVEKSLGSKHQYRFFVGAEGAFHAEMVTNGKFALEAGLPLGVRYATRTFFVGAKFTPNVIFHLPGSSQNTNNLSLSDGELGVTHMSLGEGDETLAHKKHQTVQFGGTIGVEGGVTF